MSRDETHPSSRRPPLRYGLAYGLVHSLAFGLAAWGYDTWVLARSNAELAWAKLGVGLPLLLLLGTAAGILAGRSRRAGGWVGAWMASGALSGVVVGLMPFAGYNLTTWVAEPRLWAVDVYPMGPTGAGRMAFVALITGCVGSVVGLVGLLVAERAGGPAPQAGGTRNSRRPWAALAWCLPLALLPGLIGDQIINRTLRTGQRAVYEYAATQWADDLGGSDAASYPNQHPTTFVLHLVEYDLESQGPQMLDVAFDDGQAMRCQVSGYGLAGCLPISPEFEAWMDGLIQEGLQNGEGAGLEPYAGRLSVDDSTLDWLASQREMISGTYESSRETQRGGWVIMSARFDTGYVLTCYFHGASPVTVDHCSGNL